MFTYSTVAGHDCLLRSDGAFVPADTANTDYVAYLAWLAAGNTPSDPLPVPDAPPIAQPTLSDLQAQLAALAAQIASLASTT